MLVGKLDSLQLVLETGIGWLGSRVSNGRRVGGVLLLYLTSPIAFAIGEVDYWNLTHIDYELDYEITFHNCTYVRVGELADTQVDELVRCDFRARTMGEPQLSISGVINDKKGINYIITEYEKMVRDVREHPPYEATFTFPEF